MFFCKDMFFFVCAASLLATRYLLLRYRRPLYTTQKFSRTTWYEQKSEVPTLKVPWSVKYDNYTPTLSTRHTSCPFWWFHLTYIDGRPRLLCEVSPYLFRTLPTNPYGRTGITGIGCLSCMGGNTLVCTVLTTLAGKVIKVLNDKQGHCIYRGYADHPLNTDNAWVEAVVFKNISTLNRHECDTIPPEWAWLISCLKCHNLITD